MLVIRFALKLLMYAVHHPKQNLQVSLNQRNALLQAQRPWFDA